MAATLHPAANKRTTDGHAQITTVQIAADLFKIKAKKRNVLPAGEHFSTQRLGKSVVR